MIRLAVLLFVVLAIAKAACADHLALFGDEAFYFQCARRLDFAYSDHPFMTALWVRAGLELFGPTTFATRFLFQVAGLAMPFIVFWLARPHVSRRDALLAAALSVVVPATSWLGLLAIPDAPLMLFAGLALGWFDRAVRSGRLALFLLSGLATAAGLATHLRFVLVPFGFACYLLLTAKGRSLLTRPGVWLYGLAAVPGFLPVLLFNLRHDWRPLEFQTEERHAGGASFDGLLEHVPLQLVATTPLLYVALIAVLVMLVRRARSRDADESTRSAASLFACVSLAHLGVFLVTSPIADTSHTTIHWPAPGYLALLPFLPGLLRDFVAARPTTVRRALVVATPGLGAIVVLLAVIELGFHPFGVEPLKKPFTGYAECAARAAAEIEREPARFGSPPLVVADHYILAGNLEQQLLARGIAIEVFVLDHEKNHEHGRALQFELWGMDEATLSRARAGRDALVIAEKNQSRSGTTKPQSWVRWEQRIASLFAQLAALDSVVIETGGREPRDFRLYFGRAVR